MKCHRCGREAPPENPRGLPAGWVTLVTYATRSAVVAVNLRFIGHMQTRNVLCEECYLKFYSFVNGSQELRKLLGEITADAAMRAKKEQTLGDERRASVWRAFEVGLQQALRKVL